MYNGCRLLEVLPIGGLFILEKKNVFFSLYSIGITFNYFSDVGTCMSQIVL